MEDKVQVFRQSLVTATGIVLGFILNFETTFVKTDNSGSDFTSYFIGICVLIGIISLK